ncbi:MAG: hydroxymethylbilane synthase [Bacteroidetes bacterium SW_9_63_38]|nr:MAG: hydroxymethylbilane synthase [Bacteroidetes bacterium SW_9_63_38]
MSIPSPLVVGTRASELALRQANSIRNRLEAYGHRVEVRTVTTRGDEATDVPISEIGDEAVFTRALDRALLNGEVHFAVHSLKDIPTTVPTGVTLAAIGPREDPFDAFVAHPSFEGGLSDLPVKATVATASLRRKAQLRTWRPGLNVAPVRGNVGTRLQKLMDSDWDGMVLAMAGLLRLGFSSWIRDRFDPEVMVPAVGQGALGIACAGNTPDLAERLHVLLHDEDVAVATRAERAFLRRVGGGCQVPLGAWARLNDEDRLVLDACIASLDGTEKYRDQRTCAPAEAKETGRALADDLLEEGGESVLNRILGDRSERMAPFDP